jgi:acetyl esterase/lipase
MKRTSILALFMALTVTSAWGQDKFKAQTDVVYATHDGVELKGDLYSPTSGSAHPAMMYIHGGGFRGGSKGAYKGSWGPYLASRGYVVFAIDYRLSKPDQATWPQALLDCKAALQYLRGNASALGIDPDRIGVGGDSAGGELSAMVGVTQDFPAFANKYPGDMYASASTKVKVATPIYGVYDMMAWQKYTSGQQGPNNKPLEIYLGGAPDEVPGLYYASSPIAYIREAATSLGAVASANPATKTPWFVAWGMIDPVVPPAGQGVPFVQALHDAGATVVSVAVPNSDHFWFPASPIDDKTGDPVCEEHTAAKFSCSGASPNDYILSKYVDFLSHNL